MTLIDPALGVEWEEGRPTSAQLTARARRVFPDGVTHDNRYQEPHLLYIDRAAGSRKWDVDGREYVDYWMGHGSLLLGHCHPEIVRAVRDQAERGTHYGASHALEIQWGELVKQLVPSATDGRVKFTSSGTEATLLAMRMARAARGKPKIIRIRGHFHGWHDYASYAMSPPYDKPMSLGIPSALDSTVVNIPAADLSALEQVLQEDSEIAGIILVPAGGREYLQGVRRLTQEYGVVMILDEVITGFRYSPGGAQELFSVQPDITVLAKVLAGGLPGGAVTGRSEFFEPFELRPWDAHRWRWGRIPHPGTFNGSPLSAAAGGACLAIASDPRTQATATHAADEIRHGLRAIFQRRGVDGSAEGIASIVEVSLKGLPANDPFFRITLKVAMQVRGVDVSGGTWWVSTCHDSDDIDRTLEAFEYALEWLVRGTDGR